MITIVGAGMAGLLSARALKSLGITEFQIIEKSDTLRKSQPGLHYLHDKCNLNLEPLKVFNFISGKIEGEEPHVSYSKKLGTPLNNSLVNLEPEVEVYSFQEAYDILVEEFEDKIKLGVDVIDWIGKNENQEGKVIFTAPRSLIVHSDVFEHIKMYTDSRRAELLGPIMRAKYPDHDNFVVYNVDPCISWYRYAYVNGHETLEVDYETDEIVRKIVDTKQGFNTYKVGNLEVLLVGRYATWKRKYLVHKAYYDTIDWVKGWK